MSEYYTKEELLKIGLKRLEIKILSQKKQVFTVFRVIWDQITGLMIFV